MLGRFRSAIYNAIGSIETADGTGTIPTQQDGQGGSVLDGGGVTGARGSRVKYAYQRPIFLQLFTEDEIQATADHSVRPIIVPRDIGILPWFSGYAEAINAGKSARNEDQAAFHRGVLRTRDLDESDLPFASKQPSSAGTTNGSSELSHFEIPYIYFGIFDGHAGSATAVTAANELHQIVHNRLMAVLKHLTNQMQGGGTGGGGGVMWYPTKDISIESLVIGALEAAFWETDHLIGDDKKRYKMQGGCTVLVSVFILGKLYVANAGDSRAVLCREKAAYPMSFDFTPMTERPRLQQLGYLKPHLLGSEYTHLDYCRRPLRKDLGKSMLYRDAHMTGWAYKEIQQEDLKFPLVYGEGKRSRLLATIGVTRGFGDHDLRAQSSTSNPVYIKPFLTPQPEVRVLDVESEEISEADVLVMATDGLWDVMPNERVAEVVHHGLSTSRLGLQRTPSQAASDRKVVNFSDDEMDPEDLKAKVRAEAEVKRKYRHITIAQDLVMAARGKLVDRNWKRTVKPLNTPSQSNTTTTSSSSSSQTNGGTVEILPATIDDISVFVIPILSYKEEYAAWKAEKLAKSQQSTNSASQQEEAADTFDIDKFEAEMDEAQSAETSSRRQKPLGADGGEGVEEGIEAINHQERSADQSGAAAASESSQQYTTSSQQKQSLPTSSSEVRGTTESIDDEDTVIEH